jgi:hypothetical protein
MEDYSSDNVAIFQSILYRPGTTIDLNLYPDKVLFNHATGMVTYTKNGFNDNTNIITNYAKLESGGVYTLEVPSCNLIQESLRHDPPEVLRFY